MKMQYGSPFSLTRLLAGFALAAISAAPAAVAQQRPLGDWLSAQGQGFGTSLGFPADYLAWTGRDPGNPTAAAGMLVVMDYAGIDAAAVAVASGGAVQIATQITGSVNEQPLASGRTQVTVHLHASNVLTYVLDNATQDVLFGATPADVAIGATPALGDVSLHYVYVVDRAPGAPMEDIMEVIFFGSGDLTFVSFTGGAVGLLPNTTPALLNVTQTAPVSAALRNDFRGGLADAFPVEMIHLHAIGQ